MMRLVKLTITGTVESPITIKFASGTYNFFPEAAYKKKFNISNTNDAPDHLKAVAFLGKYSRPSARISDKVKSYFWVI